MPKARNRKSSGFQVQRKKCATCIYRRNSTLDVKELEKAIADPKQPGHFSSYRICHHSTEACCAGFWKKHKDHFDLGQIMQRLRLVEYVDHDTLTPKDKKNEKP